MELVLILCLAVLCHLVRNPENVKGQRVPLAVISPTTVRTEVNVFRYERIEAVADSAKGGCLECKRVAYYDNGIQFQATPIGQMDCVLRCCLKCYARKLDKCLVFFHTFIYRYCNLKYIPLP